MLYENAAMYRPPHPTGGDPARAGLSAELINTIAHEIRQPLSVIATDCGTGLQLLSKSEPELPKLRRVLSRLKDSVERANRIIDCIHLMALGQAPQAAPIDVNISVNKVTKLVEDECAARQIDLFLELGSDLPNVAANRTQVEQVILNLLTNSMQAIELSSRIKRKIVLGTTRHGGEVLISVQDTGVGLPGADVDRPFDRFFTTKKGGMGLGLSICKAIVEAHRGTISAEDLRGSGAVFTVALPTVRGNVDA